MLVPILYQTFCDKGQKLNVETNIWVPVNFSGRLFHMDSKWKLPQDDDLWLN